MPCCVISGEVSEAKEVVAVASSSKEAKRVRGYETFQILASAVTFATHMDALLAIVRYDLAVWATHAQACTSSSHKGFDRPSVSCPYIMQRLDPDLCHPCLCPRSTPSLTTTDRDKLPSASVPSVRNKLSQLLQFAARGIRENPTASAEDLMVWVHTALTEGLRQEESAREEATGVIGAAEKVLRDKKGGCVGGSR
jgi:hypothetical protein